MIPVVCKYDLSQTNNIVKGCSLCLIQPIDITISDEGILLCCKHLKVSIQTDAELTNSYVGRVMYDNLL